jgi:hypothetical protein
MNHLTDLELIAAIETEAEGPRLIEDASDRDLPAARRRHLDACEACRGRADELRAVIVAASDAAVPEPSPLFWEHFSARVRQGIDGSAPGESAHESWMSAWLARGSTRWAAFATLVVMLMVGGVWQFTAPIKRTASPAAPDRAADGRRSHPVPDATAIVDRNDLDADPAWAVVRTVADSVDWSDAAVADIGVQPDAVETVARTLSPEERSELVKLLLAEAKRKGA